MARHRWDPVAPAPVGLVRPVRVDPKGITGPTPGQARGRKWRQTSQGFYLPASVDDDLPEQRILEQSMRLPPCGAVTGWAACRLWGGAFFDGLESDGRTRLPVPLAVGPGGNIRRDARVRLAYDRLPAAQIRVRHGIRVVVVDWAVFDAMRQAGDVREAVVALDMAVAAGLTSISSVVAHLQHRGGATCIDLAREAVPLACAGSRSPNEVRLRLVWELDAGLPRPQVNCPIHDLSGRLLGIADLLDLEAGLVVEFDGADHRGIDRHSRDVAKDEAMRGCGLEVTRITGRDLRTPRLVVRRLLDARARAGFEPRETRRWVARPVDWESTTWDSLRSAS